MLKQILEIIIKNHSKQASKYERPNCDAGLGGEYSELVCWLTPATSYSVRGDAFLVTYAVWVAFVSCFHRSQDKWQPGVRVAGVKARARWSKRYFTLQGELRSRTHAIVLR